LIFSVLRHDLPETPLLAPLLKCKPRLIGALEIDNKTVRCVWAMQM